jgi:hypothetical protein
MERVILVTCDRKPLVGHVKYKIAVHHAKADHADFIFFRFHSGHCLAFMVANVHRGYVAAWILATRT